MRLESTVTISLRRHAVWHRLDDTSGIRSPSAARPFFAARKRAILVCLYSCPLHTKKEHVGTDLLSIESSSNVSFASLPLGYNGTKPTSLKSMKPQK